MPAADVNTKSVQEAGAWKVGSFHALIADAIIAAYLRRHPADAIPFVYNLLDYLLIALPEGSELFLGQPHSPTALSTRSGGSEPIPHSAVEIAVSFLAPRLRLFWLPGAASSNTYDEVREMLAGISEHVIKLGTARQHDLTLKMATFVRNGQDVLHDYFQKLQDGLDECRGGTTKWNSDVRLVERIVLQTARHFKPLIGRPAVGYTLILRCWPDSDEKDQLVDLGTSCEERPFAAPSPDVARSAQLVFHTGFARWERVDRGVQIAIPCHVLGVPWLVMSRKVEADAECAQWWAYSIYRDHSLLNNLLRDEAGRCLAEAMRAPLAVATSQEWSDRIKETVELQWRQIPRVHPVSMPLMENSPQADSESQDVLVIHGRRYRVRFAPAQNPFFAWPKLPETVNNEGWSSIDPSAAAHFFDKLQKEFNRIHAERQAAENVAKRSAIRHYGHTMGHRIAPVVAYFKDRSVSNEAAGCARFVADISLVLQAYSVESQEEFFRLSADKANRFVVLDRQLDLLELLRRDVTQVSSKQVQMAQGLVYRYPLFEFSVKSAVIAIAMFDRYHNRACRLHDAFFAQLFCELAINAVQHGWDRTGQPDNRGRVGVPLNVGVVHIEDKQALVLSNYYNEEQKSAPGFFTSDWTRWPSGRANDGPGMAIEVFRRIRVGDMYLRVDPPTTLEPGQLHVALTFEGLKID